MTTAREEAERRYEFVPPKPEFAFDKYTIETEQAINNLREGFVAGAEWQAGQPVGITDTMVERLAFHLFWKGWSIPITKAEAQRSWERLQDDKDWCDKVRKRAREYIEAALGAEQ